MYYTLEKMMTVEDYMYALREESINSQKAAFITIQDYIEELTSEDIILVSKIEKQISEKAIKEAKELEKLLA